MFEFGDVFQRDRTIFAVRFAFDVVLKGPSAVGHIDFREIAVFVTEQFVQGDVGFALLAEQCRHFFFQVGAPALGGGHVVVMYAGYVCRVVVGRAVVPSWLQRNALNTGSGLIHEHVFHHLIWIAGLIIKGAGISLDEDFELHQTQKNSGGTTKKAAHTVMLIK